MDEVQSAVKALKKSTHKAFRKLQWRTLKHEEKQEDTPVHREISFDHYVMNGGKEGREGRQENTKNLPPTTSLGKKDILAALPVYFPEECTVVLCRGDGTPCMHQNYSRSGEEAVLELKKVLETVCLEDRDEAIREGLLFMGIRFEIFQFHPPLVYGRTAGVTTKESVGIVVVRHALDGKKECPLLDDGCKGEKECYMIVTYTLPETSAHILYQARLFCAKFL